MADSAGDKPQTESAASYKKKSGKPMFIIVVVVALVVGLLLGTVIGSVFLQEEQEGGALDRIMERGGAHSWHQCAVGALRVVQLHL